MHIVWALHRCIWKIRYSVPDLFFFHAFGRKNLFYFIFNVLILFYF